MTYANPPRLGEPEDPTPKTKILEEICQDSPAWPFLVLFGLIGAVATHLASRRQSQTRMEASTTAIGGAEMASVTCWSVLWVPASGSAGSWTTLDGSFPFQSGQPGLPRPPGRPRQSRSRTLAILLADARCRRQA